MADLLLGRSTGHAGGAFGFRGCFLAGGALQFLAFDLVGNVRCIHQLLFSPAYFSTSFFKPKRGKFTVILASSPSPSRRTTVPVPYLGCSTVIPARAPLRTCGAGGATGLSGAEPIGRGNCGGVLRSGLGGAAGRAGWNGRFRSLKNCEILSSEL